MTVNKLMRNKKFTDPDDYVDFYWEVVLIFQNYDTIIVQLDFMDL